MKSSMYAFMVAAALVAGAAPANAQQTRAQPAQQASLASLPPALRAAVQSGNSDAVSRAITTLSANNPAQAANLALQVVQAAEQNFSVNPRGAIAVAQAAVATVRQIPVQQNARLQTQEVLTTAARLFINPEAIRLAPVESAQLATATTQAAMTTNSPMLVATIASQAVSSAENLVATNPAAAIQVASVAIQAVRQDSVMSNAPSLALQAASSAARIALQPSAQQTAPSIAAGLATAAVQVASNPDVYRSSPSGAIEVMAQSYTVVSSQNIAAVAPGASAAITLMLNQAATTPALNQANASNGAQINAILARQEDPVQQAPTTSSDTTAPTFQAPLINEIDRVRTSSPA